jgi:hypothetical protein
LIIAASEVDLPEPVALDHHQVLHDLGQAEVLDLRHVRGDVAQHHRRVAALVEHGDAEAPEAGLGDREIDLELLLEVVDLLLVHQAVGRLAHLVRREDLPVHRHDLALDLDLDRRVRAEEEVRGLLLDHQLEQRPRVEHEVARRARRSRRVAQDPVRLRAGCVDVGGRHFAGTPIALPRGS